MMGEQLSFWGFKRIVISMSFLIFMFKTIQMSRQGGEGSTIKNFQERPLIMKQFRLFFSFLIYFKRFLRSEPLWTLPTKICSFTRNVRNNARYQLTFPAIRDSENFVPIFFSISTRPLTDKEIFCVLKFDVSTNF